MLTADGKVALDPVAVATTKMLAMLEKNGRMLVLSRLEALSPIQHSPLWFVHISREGLAARPLLFVKGG